MNFYTQSVTTTWIIRRKKLQTVVFLSIGFAVIASRNEHRLNYYSIQYNDNRVQNKDYCYKETLLLLLSSQHNYTW